MYSPRRRIISTSCISLKFCSKVVDERVERIWWLNIQPAMTDEAPNGIIGEIHFVRSRGFQVKLVYGLRSRAADCESRTTCFHSAALYSYVGD